MRFNAKMCVHSVLVSVVLTFMFTYRDPLELEVTELDCGIDMEDEPLVVPVNVVSRKELNRTFPFRIPQYEINCTNIHEIKLGRLIGHGVSKRSYMGVFKGKKVAVKMATMEELYSRHCIEDGLDHTKPDHVCYRFSNMKLMKEILMVQQFRHPSIMKLMGFCLRSEETEDISLEEHGLLAVYEYADQLLPMDMAKWSLQKRLQKAVELFDLFDYFEYSPIGSIQFPDLKLSHFLWAEDRIKVHDFDDVTIKEPSCNTSDDCEYGVTCINSVCKDYNTRMNLWKVDFEFSRYFFPEMYFDAVPELKTLSKMLGENKATAYELARDTALLLQKLPAIEAERGPFNRQQYLHFIKPEKQVRE